MQSTEPNIIFMHAVLLNNALSLLPLNTLNRNLSSTFHMELGTSQGSFAAANSDNNVWHTKSLPKS